MATKNERPKLVKKSYMQKLNELQESILLMVLANPTVEHAILSNYLARNGYVLQEQAEQDRHFEKMGIKKTEKESRIEAENKARAQALYAKARKGK